MSFEFFDRVYCIHLPNPDRRKLIEQQFDRFGILDVQYIYAAKSPPDFSISNMRRAPGAEFSVNLSQIKAVVRALAEGAQRPLFVEDDIVFHEHASSLLGAAVRDLPLNWDVLYLGGHPREKAKRVSSTLAKVGAFSFAEAYSIRRNALLGFFDFWCNRISKPNAMYDFILGEYAAAHNSYCAYPLICEQPPNVSQISGRHDDKRQLVARGWTTNLA